VGPLWGRAVHCHRDLGDSGWGCGYRNLQMACGFLLACGSPREEAYRTALFEGSMLHGESRASFCSDSCLPSVPRLQEWLEAAWAAGHHF